MIRRRQAGTRRSGAVLRRSQQLERAGIAVLAAGALLTGTAVGAGPASASTFSWGGVTTVWAHGFDDVSTVTTDNGTVVATWINHNDQLWYATHRLDSPWSAPTMVSGRAAALAITKDGRGAWLLGQGFRSVFVVHVDPDGSLSQRKEIGASGDPFISDAMISVGAGGAVAAAWHGTSDVARIAYRPAGGSWQKPDVVPQKGDLHGLVVGEAGTAQLVLAKAQPQNFRHQTISYLRRSPEGTWAAPVTVATKAWLTRAEGNPHGDLVVGWEVDKGDTHSLYARYRPAEGGFKATRLLASNVPYGVYVALGIADDGSAAAAYQATDTGSRQIEVTRADSSGAWSRPETLSMTGYSYSLAANADGGFVVSAQDGAGVQLAACSTAHACDAPQTNASTGYRYPSISYGPGGTITLVWGRGCKTEECLPTSLVAQRGK